MNLLLKNATLLESQNPFHKQQVDIEITDGIISKYSTPTITTVSQNGIKMGRKAAQMLIERLENEEDYDENEETVEQYKTELIETNLILRDSTKTR